MLSDELLDLAPPAQPEPELLEQGQLTAAGLEARSDTVVQERLAFEGSAADALVPGQDDESGVPDDREPLVVPGAGRNQVTRTPGQVTSPRTYCNAWATPMLFSSKNQRGSWRRAGTLSGGSGEVAVVLFELDDLLDVGHRDRVDLRDPRGFLAGADELGDDLGAYADVGDGGFAEAAGGVKNDRLVPAEWGEALGDVAGVVELDLVKERDGRFRRHQGAVSAQDHDVQHGVEADELLRLERELSARGVGLQRGERVLHLEAVAQETDDGAEVLQRDSLGPVLPQVAGLDELSPGDGVDSCRTFADHGGVGRVPALVAVDPATEAVGAQAEEPRGLAHAVDWAVEQLRAVLTHGCQCAPWDRQHR